MAAGWFRRPSTVEVEIPALVLEQPRLGLMKAALNSPLDRSTLHRGQLTSARIDQSIAGKTSLP